MEAKRSPDGALQGSQACLLQDASLGPQDARYLGLFGRAQAHSAALAKVGANTLCAPQAASQRTQALSSDLSGLAGVLSSQRHNNTVASGAVAEAAV